MPAQHTLHVALTKHLVSYVTNQVALGHYASASEVVRAGLRLLIERDVAEQREHAASVKSIDA